MHDPAPDDNDDLYPAWQPPYQDIGAIKRVLRIAPKKGTWRWVHCTGLNAPTLEAVADGTGELYVYICCHFLRVNQGLV